jgi:hypothetical protein
MKIFASSSFLAALALVGTSNAFTTRSTGRALASPPKMAVERSPSDPFRPVDLASSSPIKGPATEVPSPVGAELVKVSPPPSDGSANSDMVRMVDHDLQLFPTYEKLELIQGGGTVQTYQMPPWATRCQMIFTTEGRPLKAEAQLWLGPLRTVHTLQMDVEDGQRTPVQATLKFKQSAQVLRIQTSDSVEFPILAGVYVPSPDRAKEINDITENLFENALPHQKLKVQGGSTKGGGGATRDWIIPAHVESVQLIAWSKDVGKKSLKTTVEILQGPNNPKQSYFLQCGGGSQPYHAVFQTPGGGCVVRVRNKKFVEDGLVELCVLPYEVSGDDDTVDVAHGITVMGAVGRAKPKR